MRRVVFLDQYLSGGGAERVMCTIMRALDPAEFEIHLVLVSELGDLRHLVPEYVTVHELGISNTRKALSAYRNVIRSMFFHSIKTTEYFFLFTYWNSWAIIFNIKSNFIILTNYPNTYW